MRSYLMTSSAALYAIRTVADILISENISYPVSRQWDQTEKMGERLGELYYENQKETYAINKMGPLIELNPTFPCVRGVVPIGLDTAASIFDGHKFGCGIKDIKGPPIVYSFGCNLKMDFEDAIKQLRPDARIFTYDIMANRIRKNASNVFNLGLGYDHKNSILRSLKWMMGQNNHTYIDVLQMDIEGGEWDFIKNEKGLLKNVGQFLVEIHTKMRNATDVRGFLGDVESQGLRLFYKEINHRYPTSCSEISFIQANWSDWNEEKNISKLAGEPLFYIPTHEGLFSHVLQLQRLWSLLQPSKRPLVVAELNSWHYPGSHNLSYCDIFAFPSDVSCGATRKEVVATHKGKCAVAGSRDAWNAPSSYGLPSHSKRISSIQVTEEECVAGFITNVPSIVNGNIFTHGMFSQKVLSLVPIIESVFRRSGFVSRLSELVVVHWRRGDQLTTRCHERSTFGHDMSANCGSVDEFLRVINLTLRDPGLSRNKAVFVMTNEKDPTILTSLTKAGHKSLHIMKKDIENGLKKPLNSLEEFLLEILIGCHSKAYVSFGVSSGHCIMRMCRQFYASPPFLTKIDDEATWVLSQSNISIGNGCY